MSFVILQMCVRSDSEGLEMLLSVWSFNLTLSHLSAHVVNRLLRENWKSIPTFLNGKKYFKKCNPPDFKFILVS